MKQKFFNFISAFLVAISLITLIGCGGTSSKNVIKFFDKMIAKENWTEVLIYDGEVANDSKVTKNAILLNSKLVDMNCIIVKSNDAIKCFTPSKDDENKYIQDSYDMTQYLSIRNTAISSLKTYRDLISNGLFEYDKKSDSLIYTGTDTTLSNMSIKLEGNKMVITSSYGVLTYKDIGKTKIQLPKDEDIIN